ncbi:hypothetical protein [Hydrocarboniphaga sp.]|uniref:hypothetical protein n=1 Tax=Hydrocarboniphaga sp. TaxID=2033016 RepID=UPI002632426A|nr:hypothetical protein [Hydrocarboniphaga sp.]
MLAQADQHLVELEAAKAGQVPDLIDKRPLFKALAEHSKTIARTARAIALSDPGFATPYRMPDKPGEPPLLTHTDALLKRLEDQPDDSADETSAKAALRARFYPYEIAADFVQTLRKYREDLRAANQTNQGETQDGVENTQLIEQILDTAGNAVLELNAIVNNKFAAEPEKLRAWRTASRVESAPRRAKKAVGDAGELPATAP